MQAPVTCLLIEINSHTLKRIYEPGRIACTMKFGVSLLCIGGQCIKTSEKDADSAAQYRHS